METAHKDIGGQTPTGPGVAQVNFRCQICEKHQQVVEVTKAEFLDLPPPRPLTAMYFFCEHCKENHEYSLSRVARGKVKAVAVMHCRGCNSEYRAEYPLAEVPPEILGVEVLARETTIAA